MAKKIATFLLGGVLSTTAFAQAYDASTVDELDQLERQRVLLEKQLGVVELEGALRDALAASGATRVVGTGDLTTSALNLIKVVGLEKSPQAVFTYGGYRIVTEKGEMVLPNIQVSGVDTTHVILKDVTTGKESILWLSTDDTTSAGSSDDFS